MTKRFHDVLTVSATVEIDNVNIQTVTNVRKVLLVSVLLTAVDAAAHFQAATRGQEINSTVLRKFFLKSQF